MQRENTKSWLMPTFIVSLIVLIGSVVRVNYISKRSFWLDEAKLFWIAQGSIPDVILQNAESNSAPPLYALLINLVSAYSRTEVILRSTSTLAGILAIPAMYFLARRFLTRKAAFICSLLVAVSPAQVRYSLELREYSFTFLVATILLLSYLLFLEEANNRRTLFLTASLVVSIFTQYGLILLIVALNIVTIYFVIVYTPQTEQPTMVGRWAVAQICALAATAVVYLSTFSRQLEVASQDYLSAGYWHGGLFSLIRLIVINTNHLFDFAFRHPSLILFFSGLGTIYAIKKLKKGDILLLLFFLPIAVSIFAAILKLYPYNGQRQAMFLVPMIFILVGAGTEFFGKLVQDNGILTINPVGIYIFTSMIIAGIGLYNSVKEMKNPPEHIKPLVRQIEQEREDNDRIYAGCASGFAFRYYFGGAREDWISRLSYQSVADAESHLQELQKEPRRLWMIFTHCQGDWNERERLLEQISPSRHVELVGYQAGSQVNYQTDAWLYLVEFGEDS